MLQINCFNT